MRLLFVKPKHIGDALLLTPTLTAVRAAYPQAEIWVVVRRGCEGILAGCPAIDHLLTAAPAETARRSWRSALADFQLGLQLRRQPFDYAFELSNGDRGRWLAGCSGARVRTLNSCGVRLHWWWRRRFNSFVQFPWHFAHAVERDYNTVSAALPLPKEIPPLTFAAERAAPWPGVQLESEYAAIHPGTRWLRKRWPAERWQALALELTRRFPQLVISAGPDAAEVRAAADLQAAFPGKVISTAGKLSWAQLAGVLQRARLFVGVDTAAMHLAAACGTPTVAIFGPSDERVWRPWQVRHVLAAPPGEVPHERCVVDVSVERVLEACRELARGNR